MHAPLNLPIDPAPTTRRANRRVVGIAAAIGLGVFVGFLLFRLPFVVSTTSNVKPENTILTARLLRTSSNIRDISEHLREVLPLEGAPFSLPQLINMSKHELSLHIDRTGALSFAVDQPLTTETTIAFERLGYKVITKGKITLITKASSYKTGYRLALSAFLPWHDGEVLINNEGGTDVSALTMNHRGLTIGAITSAGKGTDIRVPYESTVIMAGSIADAYFTYPLIAESLEPLVASKLLEDMVSDGASVAIFSDAEGSGYFLSTPANNLSVEDVASIGKDLMNRTSLSTQAWTTEDGESYLELRGSSDEIATDIRAEENFTYITLTRGNDHVRLTKTSDILTISNRDITINETIEPRSSCLGNAVFWSNTSLYLHELQDEVTFDDLTRTLFTSFTEIAVNSHKIRLCW